MLPLDAPRSVSPGPDPDRVLLVGSGPASGIGVVSHQEGLPGTLALQLSERSGRGAVVEAVGRSGARLDEIPHLLHGTRASRFDAIVLTAGMVEAIRLTSRRTWALTLATVVETVHDGQSRDGVILLAGMPAPTSTDGVHGWRGRRTDRRAAALNRTSRAFLTALDHAHFAQLQPGRHLHGQPTSACYTSWASQICEVLEPLLTRSAQATGRATSDHRPG